MLFLSASSSRGRHTGGKLRGGTPFTCAFPSLYVQQKQKVTGFKNIKDLHQTHSSSFSVLFLRGQITIDRVGFSAYPSVPGILGHQGGNIVTVTWWCNRDNHLRDYHLKSNRETGAFCSHSNQIILLLLTALSSTRPWSNASRSENVLRTWHIKHILSRPPANNKQEIHTRPLCSSQRKSKVILCDTGAADMVAAMLIKEQKVCRHECQPSV